MAISKHLLKHSSETFYEALQSLILLGVRLYFGLAFLQAGWGKFQNISNTMSFFESIHIPFALLNAYVVAFMELLGGIMLIMGFKARLAAFILTIIMCVAYFTAHYDLLQLLWQQPMKFFQNPPFNFLFASLLILGFGPGLISIDSLLNKR